MKSKLEKLAFSLKIFLSLTLSVSMSILLCWFYNFTFDIYTKKTASNLFIYDKNGDNIEHFQNQAEFQKLPKHLINAFTSIEDTTFFSHYGFSVKSIIRSFWKNIKEKKIVQGGSTITEQYIKLYYGDLRKNLFRKIKNIIVSILVECYYNKEEIFESYCNLLYFGKNIYGISDAARVFFNKNYKDLTLNECALIAGIVQRPEYLNPISHYEQAIKKKNIVLKRMLQEHCITQKEYDENSKAEIFISKNNFFCNYRSIIQSSEAFITQLENTLRYEYDIYTTIDQEIQNEASKIFNTHMQKFKKKINTIEGTLIITEYKTGKIVAFVNGYDLLRNRNKAFEWKRQIGSIIKPFITYFAFSKGDQSTTLYEDAPLEDRFRWNPQNPNKKFSGEITIENALIQSNNIIPIRILDKFNIQDFIPLITPFFQNKIYPYLSLALGCIEGTPYEVINLFNALLYAGEQYNPFFIERVIRKSGGIIYTYTPEKKTIFSNQEAREKTKIILAKIGKILSKRHKLEFDGPIYAKTGTTNDAVSCWFICANDTYSIAITIGTDTNQKLYPNGITSAKTVAPLGLELLHRIEAISQSKQNIIKQ